MNKKEEGYIHSLNSNYGEDGCNGTHELDLPTADDWHIGADPKTFKRREGWASDYYELPPNAKELGDLIEYKDMNFNVGNIFKAAYRLGDKEGVTEEYDLNKIIYFAERELKRIKNG